MARNTVSFKTKGMNRDMSVSAFSSEFSFENMNLRLSTNEGNTMMSWVTERGPKQLQCSINTSFWDVGNNTVETSFHGTPIGTAVINHQLVLFTTSNSNDYIYVLTYTKEDKIEGNILFKGNLNFSTEHPLETLVSYESEMVQKVYWTDDYNQPRFINIAADNAKIKAWNSYGTTLCTAFDFAPEINLDLNPSVSVQKIIGGGGKFAAGVIQYAFTYYNKYGQETAIFHTTPLYYISYDNRGAAADKSVDNVFKITLEGLDTNFDCLRIYSIHRTSINDTPIVKRVHDILLSSISGGIVAYEDTGYNGDNIDPTELLYKGTNIITAKTLEQKDGTLFLGNIKESSLHIDEDIQDNIKKYSIVSAGSYRLIYMQGYSNSGYTYYNQLNAFSDKNFKKSVPCSGFKGGDYYRLGLQFQYRNGTWSAPVYLGDYQAGKVDNDTTSCNRSLENLSTGEVKLPIFKVTIGTGDGSIDYLRKQGYRRVRPLVVFPEPQDRVTICQGVLCPTVYTSQQANNDGNLSAQSSWFFRTFYKYNSIPKPMNAEGAVVPRRTGYLCSTVQMPNPTDTRESSAYCRQMEIEGVYDNAHAYQIKENYCTYHTPELEFDDFRAGTEFTSVQTRIVGWEYFATTYSDIDIQTESPTISNRGGGFLHKSFVASGDDSGDYSNIHSGNYGIVSGLFYNDFVLDDDTNSLMSTSEEINPMNWMVYTWSANGSLNNDINRPTGLGTASAVLSKKIISNLRYGKLFKSQWDYDTPISNTSDPQLFDSDETTILKLDSTIYMGNIDTLIMPSEAYGKYFSAGKGSDVSNALGYWDESTNPFTNDVLWKTHADDKDTVQHGLWYYSETDDKWYCKYDYFGDHYKDIVWKKNSVRMKYKSTPHLVFRNIQCDGIPTGGLLPIVEIYRDIDKDTLFGGTSEDALRENTWVPCGEPVWLNENDGVVVSFEYGDTYYQRWDCLKTYPFTTDDVNQVVEIGSFTLETRYNIAGRYDRNRGQLSNLHMTPLNFNLFNPVYSQVDNFFSYKIMDEDSYKNNNYINQVTWTLSKSSNADIDAWTHVTLANTLELDGDKGELNKLVRFNDTLLAFQDTGISQILYNENTQISTTEGVPIEIANSGKVQGKRYITGTIGCSNKHALTTTPSGIYFMDNLDRSIYCFNGELKNLSATMGFDSWCKLNIPEPHSNVWTSAEYGNFVAYYDKVNQDILFINKNIALAYSEKMNAFTSFYNYGGADYLVNIENTGLWVRNQGSNTSTIWEHNKGNYLEFFGMTMPYWMTLIGNPEPQKSKVFTNIELRASIDGDANLPFDSLEVWDEYQHGFTYLKNLTGVAALQHSVKDNNSLKKRFRIWRSDIPRDNAVIAKDWNTSYDYSSDSELNITRTKARPLDRMRNPWVYLKLKKQGSSLNTRTEIHDIVMTYYS